MAWCSHCGRNCDVSADYTANNTSCVDCGKVLSELAFFNSLRRTFQKEKVVTRQLIYKNRITKKSQATRQYKVFERREMIWCPHCRRKGEASHDHTTGIIHCVDCGKILFEDIYTKESTLIKDGPGGKDKSKLALDAKSMKHAQNATESAGQLFTKKANSGCMITGEMGRFKKKNTWLKRNRKIPTNCSYAIRKEPAEENFIMKDEEEDYSKTGGHVRGYDNKQESCDYSYDYEGGDEYDDY